MAGRNIAMPDDATHINRPDTREERISFKCGETHLEGRLRAFIGGDSGDYAAMLILCHPHPLHGGDMDNQIIIAIRDAAWARHIGTFRFNFRGTGNSSGVHDNGIGEKDDVIAALDFLSSHRGADCCDLFVCGYSFGAYVALRAFCDDERLDKITAVAPPVKYEYSFLMTCERQKLIIIGEKDDISPPALVRKNFGTYPNVSIRTIMNADHFFNGSADEIGNIVCNFISGHYEGAVEKQAP